MESSKLIFAVLAAIIYSTSAQTLTAIRCNATLPSERALVSSLYDGNDTIYLFGGRGRFGDSSSTLKYSISEDRIELAGDELPFRSYAGAAVKDIRGNMYYLVGSAGKEIYQFNPDSRGFLNVSELPSNNFGFPTIQPDPDTALLFGGVSEPVSLLSLNLTSLQTERIGRLPKGRSTVYGSSVIWVEEKNVAYIFDGEYQNANVTKYNRTSNEFEVLPGYYPNIWGGSVAVFDGKLGYIIGAHSSSVYPYDSIMVFDPEIEEIKFVRVEGAYPGDDVREFWDTSAVYVEKLNRIYLFGGSTTPRWPIEEQRSDEILYINLDPMF